MRRCVRLRRDGGLDPCVLEESLGFPGVTENTSGMNDFVRQAYDEVADAYLLTRLHHEHDLPYLDRLIAQLRPGDRVLDVGCGAGLPITAYLVSAGLEVTGIDISKVQIERAQQNVPQGDFLRRDMSKLKDGDFDVAAVVAFYSLFHTPREEHLRLLTILRTFLPVGGRLLCTFGSTDWEGEEPFLGVPMRWSHYGPEESRRLVAAAGFDVEFADIAEHQFAGQVERHLVVSAAAR